MSDEDDGTDGCPGQQELLGLLRGELRVGEVHASRTHLTGCATCREGLVDLAVGHSLMTSAARTLGDPVPGVAPAAPEQPVPDVRARRRRLTMAGTAAAAVLVVTGVGVAALVPTGDRASERPGPPESPVAAPAQRADLQRVGPVPGRGLVTMAEPTGRTAAMTVETHALPRPEAGDYYYVWLLDPRTDKMLPVGQVGSAGSTTFRIPLSLLGRYTAIDVSLERDDGDPGHSPTSVLRASYTPPSSTAS